MRLLDQGVDVHPLWWRAVDTLDQCVQVQPGEQVVEICLSQDGVEVDLFKRRVQVDTLDDGLDIDPPHDTIHVDCVDHPGCDVVGHRLEKFGSFLNQRSENLSPGWCRRSPASRWSHQAILASPLHASTKDASLIDPLPPMARRSVRWQIRRRWPTV